MKQTDFNKVELFLYEALRELQKEEHDSLWSGLYKKGGINYYTGERNYDSLTIVEAIERLHSVMTEIQEQWQKAKEAE